jgi:Secretion system C-terminal sorting domain
MKIFIKKSVNLFQDNTASNGYAYKMVFTGYGRIEKPYNYRNHPAWFLPLNDTIQGDNILTSYAVSKGMSVREGAQEFFNTTSYAYSWGSSFMTIQNKNYQTFDENHPLHRDSLRIIGTENEGFCDPNMLGVCTYYHIKMSTLKALQLRVNWLNSRDNLVAFDSKIFEYARKTMNKNVKNSPDVWVALRESFDHLLSAIPPAPKPNMPAWTDRISLPFRNWEKWLMQREVNTDGKTVPVYQLISNAQFDINNLKAHEALRTDKANSSNYMYFAVDDAFMKGGTNAVQIKVTYLDNFAGNWWIEYDASNTEINKKSTPITNLNDNKWKTITLNINDAGFNNRQNGNMDFRIHNGGNSDITVRFVRLIKGNTTTAVDPISEVEEAIKLYPNPSNSILNIETDLIFSEILVVDVLGKQVLKIKGNIKSINVTNLPNGLYWLNFKGENGRIVRRSFVKT